MVLYDFLAPGYDPFLKWIYRPFRERALQHLPAHAGATILDLACGTGQNFPLLASRIGTHGKIIGVDISSGMLRIARRNAKKSNIEDISLIHLDTAKLSSSVLKKHTGIDSVDFVICTYGFTAMRDWQTAFHRSYGLLKPGGSYLIHDIYAARKTLHARAVQKFTRSNFTRQTWEPLRNQSTDFHMDYLDPSQHLFGGRLFLAIGTKH